METAMATEAAVNRDKLMADLRVVISDAEQLLKQASAAAGQQAQDLRERAQTLLRDAQERLDELRLSASDVMRNRVRDTDHWVHDHAWTSVAIGAGVGLLLGLLIGRR